MTSSLSDILVRLLKQAMGRVATKFIPKLALGFYDYSTIESNLRGRVLDIGGGRGEVIRHLMSSKYPVIVDISLESLKAKSACDADVVQADAHYLPFRSKSFGSSLLISVLHHVRKPDVALLEAARISYRSIIWDYYYSNQVTYWVLNVWLFVLDKKAGCKKDVRAWVRAILETGGKIIMMRASVPPLWIFLVVDWK